MRSDPIKVRWFGIDIQQVKRAVKEFFMPRYYNTLRNMKVAGLLSNAPFVKDEKGHIHRIYKKLEKPDLFLKYAKSKRAENFNTNCMDIKFFDRQGNAIT